MSGWLGAAYPWVKAAHVIFVIFWVAGLFTLARHLAYQAAVAAGSAEDSIWCGRIALLRRMVMTPSLSASWILGLGLALHLGFAGNAWLHAKLLAVLAMTGFHGWLVARAGAMAAGARPVGEAMFRKLSELPAILTVAAVILVIVKPF